MSNNVNDWNAHTVAEFRKNHGKVGGMFEGAPLLIIHHKGAKTGTYRINPVMFLKDGDRYIVFASKAGADTNPDWYHNLKAHPEDVKIEVGDDTIEVRAKEITGAERDKIYAKQASLYPQFGEYERKTKRKIPVVAFTPKK
jgi:deazaflavin-dependent oxidoreductase (nitroreductase family)